MRKLVRRIAVWLVLACLVALFIYAQGMVTTTPTEREHVEVGGAKPNSGEDLKKARMTPGRVVELHTNRGEIDFVLFEKDCPKTSARIAELVSSGCYDGIRFTRVEKNGLIQVEQPPKPVPPITCELLDGLKNCKGAVGMARSNNPNSVTSVFYILTEPWRHLDYDYCVFGRVIRGIDVAMKIKLDDEIESARIRPLTDKDEKLFGRALQMEAEREVD